jgi:acetyl-CoA synthetase
MGDRPTPSWTPSPAIIEGSNLHRVIGDLGLSGYDELHRWSVEDRDGFWEMVLSELAVDFATPPSAIRGSKDPYAPEWLPGAGLNIVDSCLSGPQDAAAVIHRVDGEVRTVTVDELASRVAAFAAGYAAAGFAVGDRVAIAMPMNLEAVVAFLGVIAAGGVVVSIADSFAPDEIAVRLDITSPVAIVTQDRSVRLGRELPMYAKCVAASELPCIVVPTGADVTLRPCDRWWDAFVVPGAELRTVERPAGAHTTILFSSGTTGDPKAIPWTETTPIKAAMDGRFHHDIHEGDVVAWPTNLGWMMGPWLVYASLLNGAAMALHDDAPTTGGFVRFVDDAGVTMLGLVPSIVGAWRAAGIVGKGDLSGVRVLSSTGEASNPDDYRWLMEVADAPVIEYCGGTEIGGGYITGTVVTPAYASRFTTPALGLDLVLLDEAGKESDVGEVFLVPPSIGLSSELLNRDHDEVYHRDTPSGHGPLRRHGDVMQRDAAGTYRALGRVDDTMNLGGIKVSSAELEEVVGSVDGVDDVAAVAVPPPDGGPDRLVVFAVVDPSVASPDLLRTRMQERLRDHLNPLFRVHDVVIVDALPRTASQKVMRRVLRSEYPS